MTVRCVVISTKCFFFVIVQMIILLMVGGLRKSPFKQIEIAVALMLISFFGNGFPQFYQKIIMTVQFKLWESLNHTQLLIC